MERVSKGFRLLGASWQVLKADRELMLLPIASCLCMAVVVAVFAFAAWGFGALPVEGEPLGVGQYAGFALLTFALYAVGIFFNAAIVGAATIRLQGGDPTVRDGIRLASERLGKILGWAALAATVGLVLRALEERAGTWLGRFVVNIVGAAWSAVTFFVVPVLLYEPHGVIDSVKRSGTLFKERWGEQFVGNASIGLAMFVLAIPVAIVFAVLTAVPALAFIYAVVAFGALIAAGGAMSGIFNAALYRFAVTGEASGAFSVDDLSGSFRPRPARGLLR